VQRAVPILADKFGAKGKAEIALPAAPGKEIARFGSHGEDFAVVRRLP
jgi:hypothetical protein